VEINSLEEFKDLQKGFVVGFPDQRVTVEMIIAEGDHVATYGAYKATHTGPMGDIPATGKTVDVKMLTIFRIEGGRIAELWVEWDNMAMLSQLGLFPPPGATET
jgi:predicted ester cyclase